MGEGGNHGIGVPHHLDVVFGLGVADEDHLLAQGSDDVCLVEKDVREFGWIDDELVARQIASLTKLKTKQLTQYRERE